MAQSFDFEQHRIRAFEAFGAVRPRYVRYATAIENILRMALRDVPSHQISARAKDLDRFAAKASKPDPVDPTKPKYPNPLDEIEDMAAARVITYVLRTLPSVEHSVQREFKVVERSDKSDRLLENALVGYRSIHLIIEMKPERAALLEYEEFRGLRAEVQIRTILQHAWAEIEHDMRYKPAAEPNKILSQRFTALAGLIEVGDREFDQIYEIDERRRRELVDLAQINEAAPEPTAEPARLLPDVEQRMPTLRPPDEPTQPRELIAAGHYSDAIVRYNLLIERQPRQFAHYLGRAKARFLSGDAAGALSDIHAAETITPGHRFIARLRDLIVGGTIEQRPGAEASLAVRLGHTALRDGDARVAWEKYSEAEKLGFNPVFSVFNLAMARFIGREFELSQLTLDRIEPYPASALEFNVITLRTLCYIMAGGKEVEQSIERVRSSLEKVRTSRGYVYNARSPLFDLEQGTRRVFDGQELAKIEAVFAILHSASQSTERPLDTAAATTADQGNE